MSGHDHQDFRRVRPSLEGTAVRLRAIEESDTGQLGKQFNDPEVLYFLDQVVFPQPVAGTREWWESTRANKSSQVFAIETLAGDLIGACDLRDVSDRSRTALFGIWIAKRYWGQGYGTDALRTAARFGFREMNLHRIELHVHETNVRGIRSYEKVGFRQEGRLRQAHFLDGRRLDTIVMGLLAEDFVEESK